MHDIASMELRRRLVAHLRRRGYVRDRRIMRAFLALPREAFLPDELARAGLPGVYRDDAIVTRRDPATHAPISSSSQPAIMALMLEMLDVRPEHRVLEIGAGTGYNAALLAHRLGDDDLVTTVDLEPEITESARQHLAAAGYHPVVVTGDGARGVPERAPFDRIIATCTLLSIPRAWLAQCRPGARILTPLATGLLALTVRDAEHAEGRFLHTPAYFVPLRGGVRSEPGATHLGGLPRRAREHELFRFLLALTRGSLDPQEAYALWEREEQPQRERYGITVSGEHEWAWLDDPEGPYAWPLPG